MSTVVISSQNNDPHHVKGMLEIVAEGRRDAPPCSCATHLVGLQSTD